MSVMLEYEDYGDFTCHECHGSGLRLVCMDDMCRGMGYCQHTDGYVLCHVCKGEGELPEAELEQEAE